MALRGAFGVVLAIPPVMFFVMLPSLLELFTIVTSIEMMRNDEIVRRVVREMKTRKALKALRLLATMQVC